MFKRLSGHIIWRRSVNVSGAKCQVRDMTKWTMAGDSPPLRLHTGCRVWYNGGEIEGGRQPRHMASKPSSERRQDMTPANRGTTQGLGRSWYRVRRRVIMNAAESLRQQVYNQTGKRYGRRRIAAMLRAMGVQVSEETLRKADGKR